MGPPPTPAVRNQARPSIGAALGITTKADASARPSRSGPRPSIFTSDRQIQSAGREESQTRSPASDKTPISPSVNEEEYHEQELHVLKSDTSIQFEGDDKTIGSKSFPKFPQANPSESPIPDAPVNGQVNQNNTTIIKRELDQMKIKYKIMEKRRMDDRDKLKAVDALKAERDKFESTIQKLQRKCQAQSQEIAEWRRQLQESKAKVEEIEEADQERETFAEMATIDRQMADEQLAAATAELEILKERCEELQLEAEIIRDENKELSSGMTSEERSSAGWLQMEKENRRLRDALVALRDMTQETETSLKGHVKELEEDLVGFEALKSEHEKTKTDLAASQAVIQTLKENVDAAENQEVLVSQLNDEKDGLTEQVKALSQNATALNNELKAYQELQEAQDQTERLLQEDLDDLRGLAIERDQKIREQAKTITNLEGTLLKFKDVLNGLQSDLQELQAKKQISDTETSELNAKSRAMMELNLRLQNSAAKTQIKQIESELSQIRAEDIALHLAVIQDFVPETFKNERDPILTLLRSKRITSKANLLRTFVEDHIDHDSGDLQADPYIAFEVIEKLQWISSCCSRFHNFMRGCSAEDFSKFDAALHELEPVERSLDTMIDAAKGRDVDGARTTQDLQRIIALLSDLSEKTVPSITETFVDTVSGRSKMMRLYSELVGRSLDLIKESVRNQVVISEDDEEFLFVSQQIQELVEQNRSTLVVAGKVFRAVDEQRQRSMTLGETHLRLFEQAESQGKELSALVRVLGQGLLDKFGKDAPGGGSFKIGDTLRVMQDSLRGYFGEFSFRSTTTTDPLDAMHDLLSGFRSKLDVLLNLASNLANYSEFERHPAPWSIRAKTLRERKIVDPQMEAQLRKLQSQAQEQKAAMNIKDKEIEHQNLQIEMLEARSTAAKDHADTVQRMQKELTEVVAQRDKAVSELETLLKAKDSLAQKHEEASAQLATMRQNVMAGDPAIATALASINEDRSSQLASDIEMLKEEITSLQSAVRFLKAENHRLLYPVSATSLATTNHAWLATNPLPKVGQVRTEHGTAVAAEAKDVFKRLVEVSSMLRPVRLQSSTYTHPAGGTKQSSWRPMKMTPRYLVSQQREELERWLEWRDDLVQRTVHRQQRHDFGRTAKGFGKFEVPETPRRSRVVDGIEIVGSSP